MSLKKKTIIGAKWTTISSVITMILHFLQLTLLARLLEPSDFGLMAIVMVVIGFSNIFSDMGISNAIIQRENPTTNQLSSLYWINIIAGFLTFILFIILITPSVVLFYKEPLLKNLMYWASLTFLITPFGQQYQILLQKELKFNRLAKVEIFAALIRTISSIIFAYFGFGVLSLVWGQLLSLIGKTLLLVISTWRIWHPKAYFKTKDLEGYLSFGIYQLGDRSLSFLKSNLDIILIGKFLGSEALGYYNIAFKIVIYPVTKINPILTKVAFPVFSKIQKQNDKFKKGYYQLVSFLSYVNFPIFFGLAITSDVLIPTIFGDEWIPSIILVQILSGVGLLRSLGNPVGSLVLAKGRADIGFKLSLLKLLAHVPLAIIGMWMGGLVGLSIAYLVLQLLYCILDYKNAIKFLLGSNLKEYLLNIWVPFYMSVVMAFIVKVVSLMLATENNLQNLTIMVIIGILSYLILSYTTRGKLEFFKIFIKRKNNRSSI